MGYLLYLPIPVHENVYILHLPVPVHKWALGNEGSCLYIVKSVLVLMNDFPLSNTSQYFDGLPLNVAGRTVSSGCSKISPELV